MASWIIIILSVSIDDKLSFKDHLLSVLRKVHAKVRALRWLKKLVPADISLEFCSPLLLGINKTLNKKLESANYYALKALLNFGNSLDYDSILSIGNMQSLEHRRYYQSLVLLFKCIKGNGPDYYFWFIRTSYVALQFKEQRSQSHSTILYDIITILSLTRLHILWNQLPS